MANRYIELINVFQLNLKRELTLEELQVIKWIVAKEFDHVGQIPPQPLSAFAGMEGAASS